MPTRPVTWDLDIPPESLLAQTKQPPPPIGEVPSLKKLRNSLMGTRFELLKISTFAAFLLGFVGVSIHGSHLNNPDNQFVANTEAAFRGVTTAVSDRAIAMRDKTETLALAMTHKVTGGAASGVMLAKAELHGQAARPRQKTEQAPVEVASLEPQHRIHHVHHRHSAVEIASADLGGSAQWSGNLIDLPNFVSAKSSEAGHKLVDVVQGGIELSSVPQLRSKGQHAAEAFGSHFDVANPSSLTMRDPGSILEGLISPDSLVAAMAALLLYMIFVVVLLQIRGGLRSLSGNQAAI